MAAACPLKGRQVNTHTALIVRQAYCCSESALAARIFGCLVENQLTSAIHRANRRSYVAAAEVRSKVVRIGGDLIRL